MRKTVSILLCVCLLLSIMAGCGEQDKISDELAGESLSSPASTPEVAPEPTPEPTPAPTSTPEPETAPVGDGYFEDYWRGDVDYSELEFELYDLEWLKEYTEPIYDIAANGGSAEEFEDADYWLTDELYYIYTMYQLADLAWCRNPSDAELTELLDGAYAAYLQASDEYFLAMMTMAQSPYAELMYEVYHESYVEYFASYDPEASGQQNDLYLRESELVNEYYVLMGEQYVDEKAVAELFVELVELRNTIARLSGYENYADYAYESVFYRDYSPADSEKIWAGVKEHFAPLVRKYQEKVWHSTDMILSSDLNCSAQTVLNALGNTLPKIAPELNEAYEYMIKYGLYDIEHDPAKAQLGFTTTLYYVNQPFIFNAAYGEFYDYMDTIHEFGHFANGYTTMSDLLFGMADMDLSELQSQGMEMLFTRFYDDIFGDYADEAQSYVLMSMIYSVVDGAMYDEFLQRVYSEENLSGERVTEIFARLYEQYGYTTYYGYEYEWIDVVHNFEYPFYYISYGVSALGALEIYERMQSDWPGAVDTYMKVCAMDTEYYYFSEAVEEVGLADIFRPESYGKMAQTLDNVLK